MRRIARGKYQARLRAMLSLAAIAVALSGCLEGKRETAPSGSTQSVSLTLVTYDTSNATLLAQGKIVQPGSNDTSLVRFHNASNCRDNQIGQGFVKDLADTGITVKVPSTSPSSVYFKVFGFTDCVLFGEYSANHSAPPPPTLTSTSPGSPSRESYIPALFGTTSGVTATVKIYNDASCSYLVGTGTSLNFKQIGIQVALQPNSTTSLYAQAIEPFGNASPCSLIGTYTHTQLGPSPPVFVSVTPLSPNYSSTSPTIVATSSNDTVTVKLYGEAACASELVSGTPAVLAGTGLSINVNDNTTTHIYGKALDVDGNPSVCNYLTTYIHDTVAPLAPTFAGAFPPSPTNKTIFPLLTGLASADTANVLFFKDNACLEQVGGGSKSLFETTGIRVSMGPNSTTGVYAANVDAAGNRSLCTFLSNYKHNTIPPDPPVFGTTDPISPNNQSTTPYISGSYAPGTVRLDFFSDDQCTVQVGSGSGDAFQGAGIQLTLSGNTITTLYVQPIDEETNVGACAVMTNYAHSTLPAPNPGFLLTLPASPTNLTHQPMVVGTASSTVSTVSIYSDNLCTNRLAITSRAQFVTNGVQVTVPIRARSNLYGKSTDVYGNDSACTYLTEYVHDNVAPLAPVFGSITPVPPTNQSTSPSLTGSVSIDPLKVLLPTSVSIYDSFLCINTLGSGSLANFTSTGVIANVPANAITNLYARTFDDAGNFSTCSQMIDYLHDTWPPGKPILSSTTPASPSYTLTTTFQGVLGPNKDLLPASLIGFYSDATCQTQIGTGTPTAYTTTGIAITPYRNQTTAVYARSFDAIGNTSVCNFQLNYFHNDLGPTGLQAQPNTDGSVVLTWLPDMTASPTPKYVIKRAVTPLGPYTVIAEPQFASYYVDRSITNNTTYYYVVASTNNTGTSLDSAEVSITVNAATPQQAINLVAVPGDKQIKLSWSGFGTDMTFRVLRAPQTGGPYTVIKSGVMGSNYTDKTVVNNTAYFYVITGTNPSGDSQISTEANAIPKPVGGAPTNLTMAALNSGGVCNDGTGIVLSWSSPSYYDGFAIRRSYTPGGEITIQNTAIGTNSVALCPYNGTWNNNNFYTVAATWNGAESADSNEVGIVSVAPPIVNARPGLTNVTLSWTTMTNATGYAVYRASKSGGPWTVLDPNSAATSYVDTAIVLGQTYYYYVQSLYPNNAVGYPSFEASATPDINPNAPSNLVVTSDTTKFPLLNWTAPRNFNFFNVYRSSAFGGPYTFIGSTLINQNINSFIDTSATAGMWYYQVTAVWGDFESAATTPASYRHGYPNTISATASASNITLSWSAVAGASAYNVYRSTTSGSGWSLLGTPATSGYTDSTAAASTGYFYYVTAQFPDLTVGEPSSEVSGMRSGGSVVPSGLTVTGTTSSSVTLNWARVPGASLYKIYKSNLLNGTYTLMATVSGSPATVSSAMMSGFTYYFKVSSVISGSESAKSTAVAGTTYDTPFAPSLAAGNNSVEICWQPVMGASSYTVKRSTDGVNFAAVITGASACPVVDSTASNGNLYFYTVTAVYPGGANLTSPMSNGVTPGVIPLTPNGLTVVNNSTGTDLTFSWSFISGATAYQIYQTTTSGSGYIPALLAPVSGNANINVTGLTPGTTYFFTVTALNGSLESGMSQEIAVTTAATPVAPTALATNNTQITITWAPIAGAIVYDLQRSTDGVNFTTLSGSPHSSPYVDTTAAAGQGYYYRYLPYTDVGRLIPMAVSARSSPQITTSTQPLAPSQLTAIAAGTTSVALNWTLVPNAIAYNVYRSPTGAGGSYTLLTSIATNMYFMPTSYSDNTVSSGNTYYYLVYAANDSGVESAPSNVATVAVGSAPTGLNATVGSNAVTLNWTAFGGATSYTVRRAQTTGGPYGVIASGVGTTTYLDAQVEHGVTYYYVVTADVGAGNMTPDSNEASATAVVIMDIQVPIELLDQGIASDTLAITFERTRTTLDTSYYDGTVTYALEINATNADANPQVVSLVNASGTTVSTIALAGNTLTPYRSRVAFAPTAGANSYRLSLPATTFTGDVQVHSARIIITQTGASKTRLYIPLFSARNGAVSGDLSAPIESTSLTSYSSLPSAHIFEREMSRYAKLADTNPFELETLVSTFGGATVSVALYNENKAASVMETQAFFTNSAIAMVRSPFSENATNFDATNEGNRYGVSLRCEWNCSGAGARIYKAGLWITLRQMSKMRIFNRISLGAAQSFTNAIDNERTRIDLGVYSNPNLSFQATGWPGYLASSAIDLVSTGTADQGTGTLTPIAGSTLSFTTSGKDVLRTSPGLSINTGDRFVPLMTPTGGIFNLLEATILIDAEKP